MQERQRRQSSSRRPSGVETDLEGRRGSRRQKPLDENSVRSSRPPTLRAPVAASDSEDQPAAAPPRRRPITPASSDTDASDAQSRPASRGSVRSESEGDLPVHRLAKLNAACASLCELSGLNGADHSTIRQLHDHLANRNPPGARRTVPARFQFRARQSCRCSASFIPTARKGASRAGQSRAQSRRRDRARSARGRRQGQACRSRGRESPAPSTR